MRRFALALAMLCASSSAFSHSWYDIYCCSEGDCAPVATSRVKETASGYVLDGKPVEPEKVRRSQDGQFHACFPRPDYLRCFYAPDRGV